MVIIRNIFYLFLFILVYRLLRYFTTSLFVRLGLYTYYSPRFFTVPLGLKMLEIHLGSSYDFFNSSTFLTARQTLGFVALGLKNFCLRASENKISPDIKLKGIVYYFNASSLNQFGFKTRPLKIYECFLFSLNYFELCLLYSIVKKRFSLIPLTTVKVAYSTAGEILKYYPIYVKYSDLLTKHTIPSSMPEEKKEYIQRIPSKSIAA